MGRLPVACALLFVSLACGGHVTVSGAGGAPPQLNPVPLPPATGGAPPLVDPGAGSPAAGSPGAPPSAPDCVSTVDEVNALTDAPSCPATGCDAEGWMSDCDWLPTNVSQTSTSVCEGQRLIELELTSGEHKSCFYVAKPGNNGGDTLTGIELTSPTPKYCNSTAMRMTAGNVPTSCSGNVAVHCSGTTRNPGREPSPGYCHNGFSDSCGPCCPSNPPDCTNQPDGFPGYVCTPGNDSFCGCNCQGGEWACGC